VQPLDVELVALRGVVGRGEHLHVDVRVLAPEGRDLPQEELAFRTDGAAGDGERGGGRRVGAGGEGDGEEEAGEERPGAARGGGGRRDGALANPHDPSLAGQGRE